MALKTIMPFGVWGVLNYLGLPICAYDGILDVNIIEKSTVLTEPIEGGKLAAFNRTQSPDAVTVTLAISGDLAQQMISLYALRAIKEATGEKALCSLVTPNGLIENLALEGIGQSRSTTANATMLVVDLTFISVKSVDTTTKAAKWSPKNATSAKSVDKGRIQPKDTLLKSLLKK